MEEEIPNFDDIKSRIIDRAKNLWPIDWAKTRRYDPLIDLMISACAEELSLVYQNLGRSETRLLEYFSKLFIPELDVAAKPAYAISAVDRPPTSAKLLKAVSHFFLENTAYYFSPLFDYPILPISLEAISTDQKKLRKSVPNINDSDNRHVAQELWLGLQLEGDLSSLNGLRMYFNLAGVHKQEKQYFLRALREGQWHINHIPVQVISGLQEPPELFEQVHGHTDTQMYQYLEGHFFSLKNELRKEEWESDAFTQFPTPLSKGGSRFPIWIRIVFPYQLDLAWGKLITEVNAFPVSNRKLLSIAEQDYDRKWPVRSLKLPIGDGDQFCGIKDLTSGRQKLVARQFSHLIADELPSYTLRKGGMGRWDDAHTFQQLKNLLSIIRREHPKNYDGLMKDLYENASPDFSLFELEHLLHKSSSPDHPKENWYILMKPDSHKGTRVSYWVTQGNRVNRPYGDAINRELQNPDSGECYFLLSEISEGKSYPSPVEVRNHGQSLLLSRGKLSSLADITSYCKRFLPFSDISIHVGKGVIVDTRPDYGLTRSIEVMLQIPMIYQKEHPWSVLCENLQETLHVQTTSNLPIVVSHEFK